ncbi:sugar 3,4-ketoisomerase [Rufibacter psychrotolerans]|uniref:sugar 3,4-ketoisomerase n=1 Tax=Rufibacter psychrotolerans TaxID=2812556 RepID=UPI001967F19C|nr:FdtA/QdtA family cupin domain-containing protein [Rufibacter sp. SYSU D00308]
MKYEAPYLVPFLQISDASGNIASTQDMSGLPFPANRIFWVFGAAPGSVRGGHAHKTTKEILTVVKGQVRVETESAYGNHSFFLENLSQGLYIPPFCWITVHLEPETILCCITSSYFDEADYIREYGEFKALLGGVNQR